MRLTLQRKFFLALALLMLVLLAIFVGSSRLALQRGIGPYVAEVELSRLDWLVANLEQAYAAEGSWEFLKRDARAWHRLQLFNLPKRPGGPDFPRDLAGAIQGPDGHRPFRPPRILPQVDVLPPRLDPPPPPDALQDPRSSADSIYSRIALLAADGRQVLAGHPYSDRMLRKQVNVHGRTVGYLALAPIEGLGTRADQAFVAEQSAFLLVTGAVGLLLALGISAFMARRWLQPVERLADAARSIAGGRLEVAVPVRGDDELAQLARGFNEMSAALATIERTRQQWLHDVAHELRTPVAAMRAEIEALQDGVRVYDGSTAQRLHGQVMRLGTLVEDLQRVMNPSEATLSVEEVHPLRVLLDVADAMLPRLAQAQVRLEGLPALQALSDTEDPVLRGDAARLGQVFMNLLENSARYTHAGGQVMLAARVEPGRLLLHVDDSAPAPAAHDLPRLFERFFRAEGSRSRATGGSGLGLAICRAIVQAHQGTIRAEASTLGGLRIAIELPTETE